LNGCSDEARVIEYLFSAERLENPLYFSLQFNG
jgi:hypothetical protein